jgi:hypothetical protein
MIREWWNAKQIRKEVDKVSSEYRSAQRDQLKQCEKVMNQKMDEIRLKSSFASLKDDDLTGKFPSSTSSGDIAIWISQLTGR